MSGYVWIFGVLTVFGFSVSPVPVGKRDTTEVNRVTECGAPRPPFASLQESKPVGWEGLVETSARWRLVISQPHHLVVC